VSRISTVKADDEPGPVDYTSYCPSMTDRFRPEPEIHAARMRSLKPIKSDTSQLLARQAMTPFCASCNSMWGQLVFRLKDFVEGRNPRPQWTE